MNKNKDIIIQDGKYSLGGKRLIFVCERDGIISLESEDEKTVVIATKTNSVIFIINAFGNHGQESFFLEVR